MFKENFNSFNSENVEEILFFFVWVEMVNFIDNNPMVGATVACAVAVEEAGK